MLSNSKLTEYQKIWLSKFKEAYPNVKFATQGNVTACVVCVGQNTANVSTSVASPCEGKFRRKVGEHNAAWRMGEQQFAVVPRYGQCAQEIADHFAITFGC